MAAHRLFVHAQQRGDLLVLEAAEESHLDHLGTLGVLLLQVLQGFVDRQQMLVLHPLGHIDLVERHDLLPRTPFRGQPLAGGLDEDSSHGLRRRRKKLPPIAPLVRRGFLDPQPSLVHQRRCAQRLLARLGRELPPGHAAELLVKIGDVLLSITFETV